MKTKALGLILPIAALALVIFVLVRPTSPPPIDIDAELAKLTDPTSSSFVSTRPIPPSEIPARLATIRWFEHCGEPFTGKLSMPFEPVPSWAEAERRSADPAWETATLEAGNQLTIWLSSHAHERYQEWNQHVIHFQALPVSLEVGERLTAFQKAHGLSQELLDSARLHLLGAQMEETYRETGHPVYFFHELLEVYEAGHYPCGWVGTWPEGKLLIY